MDPIIWYWLGSVAFGAGVGSAVRHLLAKRKRKARMETLAEARSLAAAALTAELGKLGVFGRAVPVDSPEGQAILAALEAGCDCPDHEEQRRIRHAEQQMRGEK